MDNFGIYIHIPFCMSKCSYCSFISKCADDSEIKKYFDYLMRQITASGSKFKGKVVTSIYIGGGTPSFVDSKYIIDVLDVVRANFELSEHCEISIECNPCSTSQDKLLAYKSAGINRISFGIQSLNDECLKIIGRKHTASQAISVIQLAKECGFDNISADMLIGIPNQTMEILQGDIERLISCGVKHISAYMLMLEPNTKLYEQVVINKSLNVAQDDECVNMYNYSYSLLKKYGYERYEISNFAINGYECKHNINYWNCGEYVGFGVSAYSYFDNTRIDGLQTFDEYYDFVDDKGTMPKQEVLTIEQKIEEYIMLSLRMKSGIDIAKLQLLGYDILKEKKDLLDLYEKNNIICIRKGHIFISEDMFGASNQIIVELLP